MKSQKGVTLTSLAIYVALIIIVIGILSVITASFQKNIKEINTQGTNNAEIDKFNIYFLKEVKKQGNGINPIPEPVNEILFKTGSKYTYNNTDKCIYLNDNIKIAENIENCVFTSEEVNEKTVITVTIKAINTEEKTIEYVLSNESIVNISDNEANYTNHIPDIWDKSKLNSETPIYVEMVDNEVYLAPIPKGFEISSIDGENKISEGLVIKDENENEFVWVPVKNALSYEEDEFGPIEVTDSTSTHIYDSQEELNYYYGTDEEGNPYYDYEEFTYKEDKTNLETSIQKYGGFYVGRYETTYDSTSSGVPKGIGVKKNKIVLTSFKILKTGTNSVSGEAYYYRWWGLYKVQKDMYANDLVVGSIMISSKQWDAIMEFTGYSDAIRTTDTYKTQPDLSGSAYVTDSSKYDVSKNIYDLAGNVRECTMKLEGNARVRRGRELWNRKLFSFYK